MSYQFPQTNGHTDFNLITEALYALPVNQLQYVRYLANRVYADKTQPEDGAQ